MNQNTTTTKKKKVWPWIMGIIVLIGLIGTFLDDKKTDAPAEEVKSEKNNTAEPIEPSGSTWAYSEDEDKMNSVKRKYATIESSNFVDMKFPYDGEIRMSLIIRNMGKGDEVVLSVTKGQFIGGMGNEPLQLKFDDENPMNVYYNGSADGSSNYAFLQKSTTIIKKLLTSKKLMVESTFYNNGQKIFNFDIPPLTW